MTITVLGSAEQDIKLGVAFYESQGINLGNYFLDAILSDIESLYIYVGIHIIINDYYRLLSKRFPFAVYYKVDGENIYIYAVFDCRKDPNHLQKRL